MYSREELMKLGFAYVGRDVKVFKNTVLVNPKNIYLGDGCQIDDFVHIIAGGELRLEKECISQYKRQ